MKNFFSLLFLSLFCSLGQSVSAQEYVSLMNDPKADFYSVQKAFYDYHRDKPLDQVRGWKQFKRYEAFMAPRVYPSGDLSLPSRNWQNFQRYVAANPAPGSTAKSSSLANWSSLGPFSVPTNGGAGRVNFIRWMPGNTNTFWTGSPGGGLWKTTNGGSSYTTNTDFLGVIGVSDVLIDPTNTNIMYLATGDGDAGNTKSIGVLKSINGGATWAPTALTFDVSWNYRIFKMLMDPASPGTMVIATNGGVFRTTNGWASFTSTLTSEIIMDIEFKPGTLSVVYAAGSKFFRSTNGGVSFTQITAGVPTGVNRMAIAIAPSLSSTVYLVASNSVASRYKGMYRSTDSGLNFSVRSTVPNILGWAADGSDTTGQAWYDLAITVSPTNAFEVYVGAVNIWKSYDGGATWRIPYTGGIHADVHALEWLPGNTNTLFAATDGGVFRSTNTAASWSDLSANLSIGQLYRLGMSATNPSLIMSGWQDNGSNRLSGLTWTRPMGADGMECFIDPNDNSYMYGSSQNGGLAKSTDGGVMFSSIKPSGSGEGAWVTPWTLDPNNSQTIFAGFKQLYKSTNRGTSWSQVGTLTGGAFTSLVVAPSNSLYLYAVRDNTLYRSANGGTSWTNATGTLPVANASISYISVKPTDHNRVYVTFSGYSAADKVFYTSNGGLSWTNISSGLPNLPANCIVYEKNSPDRIYVGMDVGVYVKDNTMPWQSFFTGLPNVVVTELEIYYASGKIRAATYGRGLWQSNIWVHTPVSSDFSVSREVICEGTAVSFTDQSANFPTTWNWSFPGGTPTSSTSQNPTVSFNSFGSYDITLNATNSAGGNPVTKYDAVTVVSTSSSASFGNTFESPLYYWGWPIRNTSNDVTWSRTSDASATGSYSMVMDNFTTNTLGTRDYIFTPKASLAGQTSARLTFDVAYARYNATYSDTLAVYVSTNCGQTWTRLYNKGGTTLATAPDQTAVFQPTASQWRSEVINLSAYLGNPGVMFRFENRGGYGQKLYLDNLRLAIPPVANFNATPRSVCPGSSVAFTDASLNSATSWTWSFPGGSPSSSYVQYPNVTYNTPGIYAATLTASNAAGSNAVTKTGYIVVLHSATLNASQNFEGAAFPPAGWLVHNPNANTTWVRSTAASGFGTGIASAAIDNYSVDNRGQGDALISPKFSTSGASNLLLQFDMAYAEYSPNFIDSLLVLVSTNCGQTYTAVYAKSGSALATAPATTGAFVPTATQWRTETISLANFINQGSVVVKFDSRSGYGQYLYLDNIRIVRNTVPAFTGPTATCTGKSNTFTDQSTFGPTSWNWSFPGGTPATSSAQHPVVSYAAPGVYNVTLTVANAAGPYTLIKSGYVTVSESAALPAAANGYICNGSGTASLTASGGGALAVNYKWYNTSSAATSPSPLFTGNVFTTPVLTATRSYYVAAVSASGCESARKTVAVTVVPAFSVTVSPDPASVMAGGSVALAATASTASVTYKWLPVTGLSSSTAASVMASPAATTTYTVTGTRSTCTATATVIVTVTCPGPLSGSYTINKLAAPSTTNFTSFASMAARLNMCGISGPVSINVAAGTGPYTEQVELRQIAGASAANTITLNGNGNVLQFAPASTANYLVRLNGTDYFRLQNLTLTSTSASYGWGVHLFNNANFNTLQGLTINLSAASAGSGLAGVVASAATSSAISPGLNASHLQVLNTVINGGYYGISIAGDISAKAAGIVLSNNQVNNAYYYGIYLLNLDAAQASGNTVTMRTGNANSYGMYLNNIDNSFQLKANRVIRPGRYGVYLGNSNALASTVRAQVSNNMIGGGFQNAAAAVYGLYVLNTDRANIWYNSLHTDNGTAGSAAFYATSTSTALDVRNNSFAYGAAAAGYALYAPAASFTSLNYNNYYSTGSKFVFFGADKADLAALQATAPAGHDVNSWQGNPGYLSATDLHINAAFTQLANRAQPIATVATDIDGQPRSGTSDIGADEYVLPATRTPGTHDQQLEARAYPNPFRTDVTLQIKTTEAGTLQLIVTDVTGRLIQERQLTVEPGEQALRLFPAEQMPPGLYLVRLQQTRSRCC